LLDRHTDGGLRLSLSSYGRPRVDDQLVLGGMDFINRSRLRWASGRFSHRYGERRAPKGESVLVAMIDVTSLKANHAASSSRATRWLYNSRDRLIERRSKVGDSPGGLFPKQVG
jgi:hypothetical protein